MLEAIFQELLVHILKSPSLPPAWSITESNPSHCDRRFCCSVTLGPQDTIHISPYTSATGFKPECNCCGLVLAARVIQQSNNIQADFEFW